MEKADLDALIITREPNIFYLTGTISGGVLVLTHGAKPILLVHEMNHAIAEAQSSGCEVNSIKSDMLFELLEKILDVPKNIGYDDLTLDFSRNLQKNLTNKSLAPSAELLWDMRRIKDESERKLLKRAGELAVLGMDAVKQSIRDGIRENEVAAEAAHAMMRNGAEDNAFPTIVASGERSAYPHAGVTSRKIRKGDLVTVDIGASYERYRSDITRTFIVGKPSEKQAKIFKVVLEAHTVALPLFNGGAYAKEVDKASREIITESSYGDFFIHSLGNGVGLEVHEPPNIGENSKDVLEVGNVVTDEPGVYIPGFGGVRIEDTLLVKDEGPLSLTSFTKELEDAVIS